MDSRSETLGEKGILDELLPLMRDAAKDRVSGGAFASLDSLAAGRAFIKHEPMHGKARTRHAIRSLAGIRCPRLREFENLTWLRRNNFGAPEPLAAGVFWRAGLPRFQFLATRAVEDAPTLREHIAAIGPSAKASVATRIGLEVARLHKAGFVHRDLFPRNLLIAGADAPHYLIFLDAWRGGLQHRLANIARGPNYDLACLLLHAPELFEAADIRSMLSAYFDARGTPEPQRQAVLRRVHRQRQKLAERLERRNRAR